VVPRPPSMWGYGALDLVRLGKDRDTIGVGRGRGCPVRRLVSRQAATVVDNTSDDRRLVVPESARERFRLVQERADRQEDRTSI
jgi:hypothetical protein